MILELKPFKYDHASEFYDLLELDNKLNDDIVAGLLATLKVRKCLTVWDASCGTGAQSIPLSQAGFEVSGTDLCEEMVRQAQNKGCESIQFQQADMRNHKVEPVDAVIVMMNSLGHLSSEGLRDALQNFHSNLKPGGLLIADFDNRLFLEENLSDDFFVSRVCFIDRVKHLRQTKAVPVGEGIYEITDIWQKLDDVFFEETCEVQSWSCHEMTEFLQSSGFKVKNWFNRRFQMLADPQSSSSDSLLFVAQKQ